MKIGDKTFNKNKTYIMGILNVTPDSFSDGGKHSTQSAALRHAEQMILDGADIIDIGGESTRPGHIQISDSEEIERTAGIIQLIKSNFDIPVSIDTYKSSVAEEAIKSGADMINDIWGFKYDEKMAQLVKRTNTACCLMHNKSNTSYNDFINDVISDLEECIKIAKSADIDDDKIILDPGICFGKTHEHNLDIMRNLKKFNLGYPMLLGASRKSMIGNVLGTDASQRLEGTLATTVMAVQSGYMFVRVHDVKENRRVIQMTEAILKKGVI